MTDIFRRLPVEIMRMIIPYTYNTQPKEIMQDIHSYFETKKIICDMFYLRYVDLLTNETFADMNWLVNDILCFMNRYQPTFCRYADQFYEVCSRNYMLRHASLPYIHKIANKAYNTNIHFQFRVYWGLLLPEERNEFIKIQKRIRY